MSLRHEPNRAHAVFSSPPTSDRDRAAPTGRRRSDAATLTLRRRWRAYSQRLATDGTYGFELLHKPYSVEQLSRLLRKVATWQRRKRIMGE